ncbi:MAG: hypothetical protein KDJ16_07830 [Hyphomicrobiales bacterium]|nr:hypothetical protein [Hyphomicrobiales bacterium]
MMSSTIRLLLAFVFALAVILPLSATGNHSSVQAAEPTASLVSPIAQPQTSEVRQWLKMPAGPEKQCLREDFQRLACVQLPVKCTSNSDCSCSSCCGQWSGTSGICQPSC